MKNIIFIIIFSVSLYSYAQGNVTIIDSVYFESMRNKFNVKLEFDNDIETFEFNDIDNKYSVKPNTSLRTLIGFNYRFLSLKIGFSPKLFKSKDYDEKGDTRVFKLSFDVFYKKWIQTFEYSDMKGYYIENLFDENNNYIVLPNLKTQVIRGITRYSFNDKFSLKAVRNQIDIQRKSAGSFVPSLMYEYFKISDNTNLIKIQSVNFIVDVNYIYTFVINKKWYTNVGLAPGLGYGFNKLTEGEGGNETMSNDFILNFKSLISLGYSSKYFYGGITYKLIATSSVDDSVINFDSLRSIINISIGYRFKPPKAIKNSFDWVEDRTPLK